MRWILNKADNNSVFAAPDPKYSWYKPDGTLIDVQIGERHGNYEMSIEGKCEENMKLVKKKRCACMCFVLKSHQRVHADI